MADKYHIDDTGLAKLLHQLLIVNGEPSVEIHHPTEGIIIYTRETYLKEKKTLERITDMSPTQRKVEMQRLARHRRIRFATAMVSAEIRKVDISDDSNYGKDVDGKKIDIDGLIFVHCKDYPGGIVKMNNELGAFVHESMHKPPIRILADGIGQTLH